MQIEGYTIKGKYFSIPITNYPLSIFQMNTYYSSVSLTYLQIPTIFTMLKLPLVMQ